MGPKVKGLFTKRRSPCWVSVQHRKGGGECYASVRTTHASREAGHGGLCRRGGRMKGTSPLLTSPGVCLASLLLRGPVGIPEALALGVFPWSSCLPLTEPSCSTWGWPPPSIPPPDSRGLDDAAGTLRAPALSTLPWFLLPGLHSWIPGAVSQSSILISTRN